MVVEYIINSGYLAGGYLHWIEHFPGTSIEGFIVRDSHSLMWGTVHSCGYGWEGAGPLVLSFVNKVPHHLLECSDSSFNLAVCLVVVLRGHPDLDAN